MLRESSPFEERVKLADDVAPLHRMDAASSPTAAAR